jgi:hypothetical protein
MMNEVGKSGGWQEIKGSRLDILGLTYNYHMWEESNWIISGDVEATIWTMV